MQGQRGTIDSFMETFELDHGSGSTNTGVGVEQQHFWNTMLNPVENQLPDYFLPPNDASITFSDPVGHDGRTLNTWSLGEPSSSENHTGNPIMHDDTKVEHGWVSSLSTRTGAGPRLEERRYGPTDVLSIESVNINLNNNQPPNGPLFLQNSGSSTARNINLNAVYADNDGAQAMETGGSPHVHKPGGSEAEQIPYAGDSTNLSGAASGSGGYLAQEIDGRPGCSLDGRRLSCKRKALEGISGQLSLGGSSSCFQRPENSIWSSVPATYDAASSSNVSISGEAPSVNPHELLNPRLGVDTALASDSPPPLSAPSNVESSQRNFRMRMNPAHQQDRAPSNLSSAGNGRHSRRSRIITSHSSSPRLLPSDHPLDLRPTAASTSDQSQSQVLHIPGLPRNVHPSLWHGASSRLGSSSSSIIPGEANARNVPRNISEHPMFLLAPEARTSSQDPTTWNSANGNAIIPGNAASISRVGPSSGVHPPTAPTWLPLHNPPTQYPRRLSEIRRSLFSSTGSDSGGHSRSLHSLRPGVPASSQEIALSGVSRQVHHQPYPRSGLRMDRQGGGPVEIPLSFRSFPSSSGEGRSRLVSEIRNALDFMRRGGGDGLRFEDVFILDQSMLYGMADLHDRHRDMRLDVDNMSYEELLALEERIGNVSTGLGGEIVLKCLKQRKFVSIGIGAPLEVEPCCICQEEYVDGEDLGRLDCGHDFHSECIKQWLTHKNLCPICKTTALVT